MTISQTKNQLGKICEMYAFDGVIKTPFIPYIPDNWTGKYLVLGIAQNLSQTNQDYYEKLCKLNTSEQVNRLYLLKKFNEERKSEDIGIGPWDYPIGPILRNIMKEADFAVSNVVLWSICSEDRRRDLKSTDEMKEKSMKVWLQMLKVINPGRIICIGKKNYEDIIERWKDFYNPNNICALYFPSKLRSERYIRRELDNWELQWKELYELYVSKQFHRF